MNSNERFSEYVRETSFRMSLSKSQIRHLDLIQTYGDGAFVANGWNCATMDALIRKGLCYHEMDKGYFVSEEGAIVHKLLEVAGYFKGLSVQEVA